MDAPLASWVELEGCFNFRDLGGYQTTDGRSMRTGRIFRADGLQRLTTADLDRLEHEIGLGLVIDLRSSDEVREDGRGAIEERIRIDHMPLFPEARERGESRRSEVSEMLKDMGQLYYLMLQAAAAPIAQVVCTLADSETPAVFHCAAGKDRTGVISALLLSILGVPEETIVADYAFSRQNIDQINARLGESESYQRIMSELPEGAYDADPAAMERFLAHVAKESGSMLGWAEGAGIDAATQERLRERMLV